MSTVNSASDVLAGLSSTTKPKDSSSTSSSSSSSSLGKNDFLQLLVTQLNNQNPLDPQDNSEFVAQLAQFSQVEGMENLNASVNTITSGFQSSQALQASSLVGRSVIAQTDKAVVDTSTGITGAVKLPEAGTETTVSVYDSAGAVVKKINLGAQEAGNVTFEWDGTDTNGTKLAAGTYTFKATATIDDTKTALSTYMPATVSSVTLGQDGGEMTLNLAGMGSVKLSQVQVIGQ
ncbi:MULTISPECIES: flagellar hook assembly protein FlgD [Pseudomonas]|uniref:Basal-body rod modification protein FlgD n=1 Tax=Pseudomonas kuykendallii TaxID=1007099 RepID=A0A1H3BSL2_9PSED|nr:MULTISPECIES: flagellar hook assembly protein FlgD [Pseudomonas]MCQ4269815.1 flagellar hook assembly protein FlgD [Pseudomonas kuykendallii]SDX44691.1 flagellar basal-body rod modification protein FlgD [Pseudomonas kuykendallii]